MRVDPSRLTVVQRRLLGQMRAAHPDAFESGGWVHVPVMGSPTAVRDVLVTGRGWPADAVEAGMR